MMPPGSRALLADDFSLTGDDLWSSLFLVLLSSGPAHAFAGQFDAMGVVNEAVKDRVGVGGISKRFSVSRTVEAATSSRRAISRVGTQAENFRRMISRAWRIATLSAGIDRSFGLPKARP